MLGLIFAFGFTITPPFYLPISVFCMSYGGKAHSGFLVGIIDGSSIICALVFDVRLAMAEIAGSGEKGGKGASLSSP